MHKTGFGGITRLFSLVDINTIPSNMTGEQFREWIVLDTLDMLSQGHDHPQKNKDVVQMFTKNDAKVTFFRFYRMRRRN